MPQVTSSRVLPPLVTKWQYYSGPSLAKNNAAGCFGTLSDQTGDDYVNSWRTNKALYPPSEEDSDEYSSDTGSQIDFIHRLATERRNSANLRGDSDNGHDFVSRKSRIVYPNQDVWAMSDGIYGKIAYKGRMLPCSGQLAYPNIQYPSVFQVNADGAKLFGAAAPTASEASLATFLGELRERLPALIGASTVKKGFTTRAAGEEHLNMQFGLKPFINDLQKLASGVLSANQTIARMKRDSGRQIRRRRSMGSSSSIVDVNVGSANFGISFPYFPGINCDTYLFSDYYGQTAPLKVWDTFQQSVWFSGAYSFHLHSAHTFLGQMKQYEEKANLLLGTRITADTVWQLTPWSWLIDWFTDVGSFIHNVTLLSNDSLVLRYGYVMHETRAIRTYQRTGLTPGRPGGSVPSSLTVFLEKSEKRRTRATPYGFGINLENLSPSRWAILAALGMTKAPKNLKILS